MNLKKLFLSLYIFLFLLSSFSASELRVTPEHPFLINNSWIPASELQVGDFLTTPDGNKVVITNLTSIETEEPPLTIKSL